MSDKIKKALMKDFQIIKKLENDYPMLAASPFILEHKENYDKLRDKLKALEKAMLFGGDDPTGPGDEVEKDKTQEVISIKNLATFKQVYTKWANKIINDLAKYVGNEEVIDYALIIDSIGLLAGDDNVFTKNLFSEILAEVEKVNPPVLSKLVSILRQLFNKYKNLSDKELAALWKQNKKALKSDAAGAFLNDLNSFNIVELIENALAKKGKTSSNKLAEEKQKEIETNVSYFNDWYSKNLGSLIEIEQNLSANLSEDACAKADAVKNFKGTIATLYSNLSCNNLGELIVENINNDNILSILKTIIANYSSISNFSLEDKAAIGKMYNLNRGANTLGLIFEQFIQAKIKDAQKIAFTNGLNVDANVKGQMDVKNSGNIGVKFNNELKIHKPKEDGKCKQQFTLQILKNPFFLQSCTVNINAVFEYEDGKKWKLKDVSMSNVLIATTDGEFNPSIVIEGGENNNTYNLKLNLSVKNIIAKNTNRQEASTSTTNGSSESSTHTVGGSLKTEVGVPLIGKLEVEGHYDYSTASENNHSHTVNGPVDSHGSSFNRVENSNTSYKLQLSIDQNTSKVSLCYVGKESVVIENNNLPLIPL